MNKRSVFAVGSILLLSACASAKADKAATPEWVDSPYAECSADELCAVGSGRSLTAAKADGRAGLAKVFQARVKSSFSSETKANGDDLAFNARDYVSESSDVLLTATDIRDTFTENGTVYALATLDKAKAAKITREEIDDLDAKMEALLKEDSPAAAVKLEKLYEQRRGINQRYITLTGQPIVESVSYEQVYGNKKARIGKRHIYLQSRGGSPAFVQAVRKVLAENGYTFAVKPDLNTPVVGISLQAEEQFLKVKGFVKYDYHFTLSAPDKRGVDAEVLATTLTESGLNEKQAYGKALESLQDYLKENILNLNF